MTGRRQRLLMLLSNDGLRGAARLRGTNSPSSSFLTHGAFRDSAMAATLIAALIAVSFASPGHAYFQKAVDQLRNTNACVRCDLRAADLSGFDLRSADLTGAYLIDARLEGANLSDADLRGAHMAGAILMGARLDRADFTGADLTRADFRGARLHHASLKRARLSGASFGGASLLSATLEGARLQGADLSQAQDLSQSQLDGSCGDSQTKLPEGLRLTLCANAQQGHL